MRGKNRIYTRELIEQAVNSSFSISESCRKLGIERPKGGSYELIKNRIKEYNLDTSHFLGQRVYAGKNNPKYSRRRKSNEVLVSNKIYRESHRSLKKALLEEGVEYKCLTCGINEWNGSLITLDVDHINGDWTNCELQNLRFLCPNCHRQTSTFAGKNKTKN